MSLLLAIVYASAAGAAPLASWDLEADDGGLTSGGETGQWAWGPITSGPGSGVDGARAWATVLDGPHRNDSRDTLTLPALDLQDITRPVLGFAHWYEFDTSGDGDLGWVETRRSSGWERLDPVYGYPQSSGFAGTSNGWEQAWFDLSGIDDLSDVRLVFDADVSVALAGWYIDALVLKQGDAVPPSFKTVVGPGSEAELQSEIPVEAEVRDDLGVQAVEVVWSVDGAEAGRTGLQPVGGDLWTGGIPPILPGTTIGWWLEATDGVNTTVTAPQESRVFLPAPTNLRGPEGRTIGRSVELGWTPPESSFERLGHIVYADGIPALETTGASGSVPVGGRDPTLTVRARYDTPFGPLEGDPSVPLEIDLAFPEVRSLVPAEGYQSDEMRVTLSGLDLLLAQDDVAFSLGEGIESRSLAVQDVNTAVMDIRITGDASAGTRDLLLITDDAIIPFEAAFTVLSGDDRPRITEVEPTGMEQGTRGTLLLELSSPPSGPADSLLLDAGPGVIVESLRPDGTTLEATVAVMEGAPIGPRGVEVDDGVRIIGGAELRIRPPAQAASGVCATGLPGTASSALFAFLGLMLARRRPRDGVTSVAPRGD